MTAITTTIAPTTIPAAAMNSQLEIPPPSSTGSARRAVVRAGAAAAGGAAGVAGAAGAAAIASGRTELTGAAPASFDPHFWQNERVAGLAVPHVPHRTRGWAVPTCGAAGVVGGAAAGVGCGGALARAAAVRSVPQLPQNWSSAELAVPQRGQVTGPEPLPLIGGRSTAA
jgi:hypothetical protein